MISILVENIVGKEKNSQAGFRNMFVSSSSEHIVLKVSYCDRSMSVVRLSVCLSVSKQLLKNLLL